MEKRRIEKIPIDLIEDPKDAVRQYIDEEALEELVNSLKTVGFIQPLIVKKKNEHYELIVGHRRLMAAKMANFLTVPCIVSDLSEEEEISYKIHENVVREDVDPVGEAEFLQRAMRKLKLSIPQLAEKIKRSESYVRERLEILNYPQDIREALIQKQISLGVAKYLAQVDNDLARKDYLSFAIRDGLTASLAKRWLQAYQARKMEEIPRAEELKVEIKPAETPPTTKKNLSALWHSH
jgi:ParB family chromosome partitioning protein